MKGKSLFLAPFYAFYSKDFYNHTTFKSKETGFLYLFVLLSVCLLGTTIKAHYSIKDFIENDAPDFVEQIPKFEIKNGFAYSDVQQPYEIVNRSNGEPGIIIDTTNSITSLEGLKAQVLINKEGVYTRKNDIETRFLSFRDIDSFRIDQPIINHWLELIKSYGSTALFIICIIFDFIITLFQILFFCLISLIFSSILKISLSFKTLLRVSIIAITPYIVAKTIFGYFGASFDFINKWDFIIGLIYLFIILKSASKDKEIESKSAQTK